MRNILLISVVCCRNRSLSVVSMFRGRSTKKSPEVFSDPLKRLLLSLPFHEQDSVDNHGRYDPKLRQLDVSIPARPRRRQLYAALVPLLEAELLLVREQREVGRPHLLGLVPGVDVDVRRRGRGRGRESGRAAELRPHGSVGYRAHSACEGGKHAAGYRGVGCWFEFSTATGSVATR